MIAIIGVAVLVVGLVRAESVTGVFEQVQVVALGAFGLLVGVVVLLATVARPIAGAVGRPLRVLGMSGVLARANAMRNPRRTAVTASALVIGLALVGLTATFGASAKASVRRTPRGASRRLRGEVRRLRRLLGRGRRPTGGAARACCGRAAPRSPTARSTATSTPSGPPTRRGSSDVVSLDFVSGGVEGSTERSGVLVDDVIARRLGT